MVVVALAPIVVGDTHEIIKGEQGPNASAKSWEFSPSGLGACSWHVVNNGLRWLVINVYDITTGSPEEIMHERIRFATQNAFPTGEVDTKKVVMSPTHKYLITAIPNGPKGSYCYVMDMFVLAQPPVPTFSMAVDHMTVAVDASGSYDADGTIVSWTWIFGDGGVAWGMTATHTYATPMNYTIMLILEDNDGLTNEMDQKVSIVDLRPVASFVLTTDGLTVSVDASGSWDDYGIVGYNWNWGDGTTGTGKTATHTFANWLPPVSAQTVSGGKGVPILYTVFGFVYGADGLVPLQGVAVTITNTRTLDSQTVITDEAGYYAVLLSDPLLYPSGLLIGDLVNVTAVFDGITGWNEGVVNFDQEPFLWLDITMEQTGGIHHFPVTLTVTDTIGQNGTATEGIAIAPLPVASFTCTISGSTVYVDASGSSAAAGIASYDWNWGDGATGSGMIASHSYGPFGLAPTTTISTDGREPPVFPYVVFGYVYLSDGVTPSIGASVVVTNLRSGFTATMITDEFGFYQTALDPGTGGPPDSGGPMQGDPVNVTATKDAMIGWNEGVVDVFTEPYLWLDVVLSGDQASVFEITLTVTDTLGQTSSVSMLVMVIL